MRTFKDSNPIAVTLYFLFVTGITMFLFDPILNGISFLGALIFSLVCGDGRDNKKHLLCLVLFVATALINPLVSHNGVTVLFFINDNPITLESLLYGCSNAFMLVSVLYWFSCFSYLMDSDKLLYVFGSFSPKSALVFSMALRYIPLFGDRSKKIRATQKTMGLYKDGNILDMIRGRVREFSIMTTWALEKGIITADSMSARGYGRGRRTRFTNFRFYLCDVILLILSSVLAVFVIMSAVKHDFVFYPAIVVPKMSLISVIGYVSYGVLVLIPTINEWKEEIRWRYLRSKI